ncbi:MAG: Ig-like domain-containing protein [Lachnospiraceae bacterium]|nr:Ig-like domain-containing protein [Lachnospiraceae bacterium]
MTKAVKRVSGNINTILFIMFASVCMTLAISGVVRADDPNRKLYVGGTLVTDGNAEDIPNTGGRKTGKASYDKSTNTLTLTDYRYTGEGSQYIPGTNNIAAIFYEGLDDLNLVLKGANEIYPEGNCDSVVGIASRAGNLNISGDGRLLILTTPGKSTFVTMGIFVENRDLHVGDKAKIMVKTGDLTPSDISNNFGVRADHMIYITDNASFEAEPGNVTGILCGTISSGIKISGNPYVRIQTGDAEEENFGIKTYDPDTGNPMGVIIEGGTVDVRNGRGRTSYGIYGHYLNRTEDKRGNGVTITGGDVTAASGVVINNEGQSIAIIGKRSCLFNGDGKNNYGTGVYIDGGSVKASCEEAVGRDVFRTAVYGENTANGEVPLTLTDNCYISSPKEALLSRGKNYYLDEAENSVVDMAISPFPEDLIGAPAKKVVNVSMGKKATTTVTLGKQVWINLSSIPSGKTAKDLTWKSSNTRLAKVNKSGLVTLKKAGTVRITVTTPDKKKKTVVTIKIADMTFNKGKVSLTAGKKKTIYPKLTNDKIKGAATSDSKIASVSVASNKKGIRIKAKKAGKVTITVTSKAGISREIVVKVKKKK